MERKIGTVYSVHARGWVFIAVSPIERYFSHISAQKSDHMLFVGERVSFLTAPPRKDGQLPCAVDVTPVEGAQ